jgi:hypothetical protein
LFPQIDGTHIPIIAPSENSSDFYNRKGYYSIIMQAVVAHSYKFIDINVDWHGKVHDLNRAFNLPKEFSTTILALDNL